MVVCLGGRMKSVALIGCGYWGSKIKRYVPEFFNLKYVCDSKTDLSTILKDDSLDSVIIATPINTHYELAKKAIEAGKHIFLEKPIALTESEGLELKRRGESHDVVLGVNYTQTFSKGISKAVELIKTIGKVSYIEMSTKHLGRFLEYDVYWLLASHNLSVLGMIVDLNDLSYSYDNYIFNENICTAGSIKFWNEQLSGRVDVSLNFPGKENSVNIYGDSGTIKFDAIGKERTVRITCYDKKYKALPDELVKSDNSYFFDESHNLRFAMEYFSNLMDGGVESNVEIAIAITRILEGLWQRMSK